MSHMRITVLLTVLLSVAVVGAGLYIGVLPQYRAETENRQAREIAETENRELELQLQRLHQDSEQLAERRSQFNRQLRAFPDATQYDVYLEEISGLAGEQDLMLHEVTVQEKLLFDLTASPWDPVTGEYTSVSSGSADFEDADPQDTAEETEAQEGPAPDPGAEGLEALAGPFQGRELIAVPIEIDVSGGASGVHEFVRTVQSKERYTAINQVVFTGVMEEDLGQRDTSEDDDESEEQSPVPVSGADVLDGNVEATLSGYIWVLRER